jgi:thiamine monophosphate kinase
MWVETIEDELEISIAMGDDYELVNMAKTKFFNIQSSSE